MHVHIQTFTHTELSLTPEKSLKHWEDALFFQEGLDALDVLKYHLFTLSLNRQMEGGSVGGYS